MVRKHQSLDASHPDVAAQADGWDPTTITPGSEKKMSWRCQLGHQFQASVKSRALLNSGCPVCANQQVLAGFNDLKSINPDLAAEAFGWDPTTVTVGHSKKKKWLCPLGHTYQSSVSSRTRGSGCPICSRHQVLHGFNDLKTCNPDISLEADGWDPASISPFSNKKMTWRCPQGHQYIATVAHRSEGRGCPFCSGRQVLKGFNDLATTHPELAAEAFGWDPTSVSAGSHKRMEWTCEKEHVWLEVIKERTLQGFGCPYCSGKRVLAGFNDLATTHPELAAEAFGWDPTTLSKGSNKKREWKCSLGHIYEATVGHRTNMRVGCSFCAGKQVLVGFNDLATTNSSLAAEATGWDPSTVTMGSNKKRKWRCSAGHVWITSPKDRARGEGCPSCAKSGFDPNRHGWLYLLFHDEWNMFQIGLTNSPGDRLKDHRRNGFNRVIDIRGPMEGSLAQQLERAALRALAKRGALFSHKSGLKKFDGYSETWTHVSLEVTTIKQILSWVYEDEALNIY